MLIQKERKTMAKKQKISRVKRRYICEKCGRKSAVKHDKGRFRCLECHSIYGANSRKTCYNKDEYLVLKTLLQLFYYQKENSRKNTKYSLKQFTETLKNRSVENFKKLVEVNVINRIDVDVKLRLLNTDLEDMIILTKDDIGRFQLYTKLFKKGETYNFSDDKVKVESGGRYYYENNARILDKERETLKRSRIYK